MDDKKQDTPLTMATIQAFRKMLDVMEEFIKNTEAEKLMNETEKKMDKESQNI